MLELTLFQKSKFYRLWRTSIQTEYSTGAKAGCLAGKIQGGTNDFVGFSTAAQGKGFCGFLKGRHAPSLADIGKKRTAHDTIDPHLGAEGMGEALSHCV